MERQQQTMEKTAMRVTEWVGTPVSVLAHTLMFGAFFALLFFGVPLGSMLLVLTTVVSLEAIYLAIFIQMTVNRNTESLEEVGEDIEEIQEDVKELETDVDEISKDVEEISEDVEEISKDVEEISEDAEQGDTAREALQKIETNLQKILNDIETLKRTQ